MTEKEFVQEWMHDVDGWLMDTAMTQRNGRELSVFLRGVRAQVAAKAAKMYRSMQPQPEDNGQAKTPLPQRNP